MERIPASTILREVATQKEAELTGKNEYADDGDKQYGVSKVPVEIDGAGTERTKLTVSNMYNADNEYKNPDGDAI